jgi:hypothetical protein
LSSLVFVDEFGALNQLSATFEAQKVDATYVVTDELLKLFGNRLSRTIHARELPLQHSYSNIFVGTAKNELIGWLQRLKRRGSEGTKLVFALDSWVNPSRYLGFDPGEIWTWDEYSHLEASRLYGDGFEVRRIHSHYLDSVRDQSELVKCGGDSEKFALALGAKDGGFYEINHERHGAVCICRFVIHEATEVGSTVIYRQHPGSRNDSCLDELGRRGLLANGSVIADPTLSLGQCLGLAKTVFGPPSYSLFLAANLSGKRVYSTTRTLKASWAGPTFNLYPI